MGKRIDYTIGINADTSGIQKLKQELNSLNQMSLDDLIRINPDATKKDLESIKASISTVQDALDKSYNFKLDSTNITTFRQELSKSEMTIGQLGANLSKAGVQGQLAFKQMATDLLTTNTQLKQSYSLIDSMAKTLGNTLKWSITSSAINSVTSSIQQAWGYTKSLDESLNNIRIVTGKSADSMDKFAKKANSAAKALGSATKEYTNAALIYYQQGLDEEDVQARTDVTLKAANVTGQSAAEVSEQLTAVWNGYRVVAEDAEKYIDKLSAVAASTASDLEELSESMAKVASGANAMGVDIDQLTAQLSTIISVTRQDASSVGTALKTIFARMGDLKVDGVDEFGVSLGDVSGTLQKVGVEVLDQQGNLRDMGTVMGEVAGKWGTWTEAQQQAVAVAMAGKRQYNNLLALFENWDMYESALSTSQGSEGTLQKQQDIYMDSLEGRLNQLSVAGEKVYDAIFDSDSMKDLIGVLTDAVDIFASFVNSIGGGGQMLASFGSIAFTVFRKHIASGITTAMTNLTGFYNNTQSIASEMLTLGDLTLTAQREEIPGLQEILKMKEEELSLARSLSAEDKVQYDNNIAAVSAAQDKLTILKEEAKLLEQQKFNNQESLDKRSIVPKQQKRDEQGRFISGFDYADLDSEEGVAIASAEIEKRKTLIEKINKGSNTATFNETSESIGLTREDKINEALDYANSGEDLEKPNAGSFGEDVAKLENAGLPEEEVQKLKEITETLVAVRKEYIAVTKEVKTAEEELAKAQADGGDVVAAQTKLDEAKRKERLAGNKVIKTAENASTNYANAITKEKNELSQLNQSIKNQPKLQQKNIQAQKLATKELEKARLEYKRFAKEAQSKAIVNNILGVAGGISQIASAVTSLHNLGNIFKDEDMTAGEKFLAVVQNLGMNLPMLVSGIGSVTTAFQGFGKAQNTATMISKAFSQEQMQSIILQDENSIAQARAALLNMGYTSSEIEKDEAVKKTVKDLDKQKTAQLLANMMSGQATAANAVQTASEDAKGKAMEKTGNKGFLAGLKIQLGFWPILVIGLAIAAVLATIIALFVLFGKKETDLEKANKALKREQEVLEQLNENYKTAVEELKNINDQIKQLEEKQKIINGLVVGTEEWNKALQENNMMVLELLEKYPELAKYIATDANGLMSISQEGQDYLINEAQSNIDNANASRIGQRIEVLKSNNKILEEENEEAQNITVYNKITKEQYDNYVKANTSARSRVFDVNTMKDVNGVQQYTLGAQKISYNELVKDSSKENEAEFQKYLTSSKNADTLKDNLIKAQNEGLIKDIAITEELVDTLFENKNIIYENSLALAENSQAITKLEQQMAAQFFANNEDREDTINKTAFDKLAAKEIADSTLDAGALMTNNKEDKDRKLSEDGLSAYAEALGKTKDDFEYIEDDGKQKIKLKGSDDSTAISIEDAAEIAAKQEAANSVGTSIIKNVVNNATSAAEAELGVNNANTLVSIMGGTSGDVDTKNLSQAVLNNMNTAKEAMFKQIARDYNIDTKQTGWEDLVAQELGYENAAAYDKQYEATKTVAQDAINKATSGLYSKTTVIDTSSDAYKNVSIDGLKTISAGLENAFKTGGKSGADALKGMIESFASDPETQEKIASIASSINFSDANAMDQFISQLSDAGLEIDTTSEYWKSIVSSIEAANNASSKIITNFSKVRDTIKEVNDIANELKNGDIISDEEYKKLIAQNSEIKDMFIMTADGMKFIGTTGSEIIDKALNKYDDLEKETQNYNKINSAVKNFTGNSSEFKNGVELSASSAENVKTANGIMAMDGWQDVLTSQGNTSIDAFQEAVKIMSDPSVDTSSTEYLNAKAIMNQGLKDINTTIDSYRNGGLEQNYKNYQEVWATADGRSFSDIKKAYNGGNLDEDVYEKVSEYWKNNYATKLGYEEGYSSNLGADELEQHLKNIRSLELDYFKKMDVQISALDKKIDNAFGADKINLLNEQIELQEESLALANEQAKTAKDTFQALSDDFISYAQNSLGVDENSLMTNGELDINKLLDLQLNYEEGSAEFNNIQNLIDKWSLVEETASAAADAANSLIDSQINAFKAQTDMMVELKQTQNEWRKFIKSFHGFATGSLDVFEEENAADIINESFSEYNNLKSQFGDLQSQLNSFGTITDNYLTNYSHYIAAEINLAQKKEDVANLKEEITTTKENKNNAKIIEELEAELSSAETALTIAEENFDKYDKEKDNFSVEKITNAKTNYETAIENRDTEIAKKAAAYETAKENEKNKREELSTKTKDAADDTKRTDAEINAIKKAQAELDSATEAVKTAEAEYNSIVSTQNDNVSKASDAYSEILKQKSDYDLAQQQKTDAENKRLLAAQATVKAMFSEDELTDLNLNDYDAIKEKIRSYNGASSAAIENQIQILEANLKTAESAVPDLEKARKTIAEQLSKDNPYATVGENGDLIWNEEAFNTDFNDYLTKAQETLTSMQEQLKSAYDGYISAQDELMEIYDKEIEKLSSINGIIQSTADLWKLVGKNAADYSNKLNGYYNSMVSNLGKSYEVAQDKLVKAITEQKKLNEIGAAASSEMIETVQANVRAATEEVLGAASEWMSMIAEKFSVEMSNAIDDFVKKTTGMDLSNITQDWGIVSSEDDRYLDSVNATYGIDELNRKFQKSIDETDSYTAQKKLAEARAQQEQKLNKILEERGKLSQYELDRANAEYELTLKQIALEEAQQTANKMKLTRDASGNYSYQYVADQDAIAKAEEELAKAQNDLYNIDKERNKELVDEYYNIMSEANDAINEAVAAGDIERAKKLSDMYFNPTSGILAGIQEELKSAEANFENMGEILGGPTWTSALSNFTESINSDNIEDLYNKVQGIISTAHDPLKDIFGEDGISGLVNGIGEIDTMLGEKGVIGSTVKAVEDLGTEASEFTAATTQVLEKLPTLTTELDTLSKQLDSYGQKYQAWLNSQMTNTNDIADNTEATKELTNAMYEYLDALEEGANKNDGKYGTYEKQDNGDWILVQNSGTGDQ